ncbi:MAG: hypothetical protein HY559_06905 [Gammaproteobacteria bacterium]|nr:hypothetical protein [Gammaproteobacteria bacterium]
MSKQLAAEIRKTPKEYLPFLLSIVHAFRESVCLKMADESFRQGWEEAMKGDTKPVSDLWDDV